MEDSKTTQEQEQEMCCVVIEAVGVGRAAVMGHGTMLFPRKHATLIMSSPQAWHFCTFVPFPCPHPQTVGPC